MEAEQPEEGQEVDSEEAAEEVAEEEDSAEVVPEAEAEVAVVEEQTVAEMRGAESGLVVDTIANSTASE